MQLQSILDLYEQCLRQMINRTKSVVFFSPNTSTQHKQEIFQALNIERETRSEKYLGLSVHVEAARGTVFTFLKDRI
jgi:hypothetical protein